MTGGGGGGRCGSSRLVVLSSSLLLDNCGSGSSRGGAIVHSPAAQHTRLGSENIHISLRGSSVT